MYVMNALTEEGNIQEVRESVYSTYCKSERVHLEEILWKELSVTLFSLSLSQLPLNVPLIDGPQPQATSLDHPSFTGHYPLPEDSRIKIEQLLLEKWNQEKYKVESTVQNNEPSQVDDGGPVDGPAPDVLGFSFSLLLVVAGTVVFSSLVASVVAVLVTKSTQNVRKSLL